jgi:RNA polymerase sigma-70 factor (ECF subfamily)
LAQDVLMKAYRHLGGFRSDAKFSTWLYSITRNHCLNYLREKAVEPLEFGDPIEMDIVDGKAWDALAEMERRHLAASVRQLVSENLDETEAKVMFLHFAQEIPVATVTRLLGLTNASGAKAFIMSAKRKLSVAVRRMQAQQSRRPQ